MPSTGLRANAVRATASTTHPVADESLTVKILTYVGRLILVWTIAAGTIASAADSSGLRAETIGADRLAAPSSADDLGLSAGLGFHYASGKYGGTDTTKLWNLPLTVYLDKGDWGYDLTLPYLIASGPTGRTIVAGRVVATGSVAAGARAQIANVSGMGDVVTGVTRFFGGENNSDALLYARLQAKFGTADADKGLGTGQTDYSGRIGAAKAYDDFTLSGEVGYTHYGSPTGVTLKNGIHGTINGSFPIGEHSRLGASLYASQTIVDGASAPLDITIYWKFEATKATVMRVYLLKGLSNGSADYGFGLAALISF